MRARSLERHRRSARVRASRADTRDWNRTAAGSQAGPRRAHAAGSSPRPPSGPDAAPARDRHKSSRASAGGTADGSVSLGSKVANTARKARCYGIKTGTGRGTGKGTGRETGKGTGRGRGKERDGDADGHRTNRTATSRRTQARRSPLLPFPNFAVFPDLFRARPSRPAYLRRDGRSGSQFRPDRW